MGWPPADQSPPATPPTPPPIPATTALDHLPFNPTGDATPPAPRTPYTAASSIRICLVPTRCRPAAPTRCPATGPAPPPLRLQRSNSQAKHGAAAPITLTRNPRACPSTGCNASKYLSVVRDPIQPATGSAPAGPATVTTGRNRFGIHHRWDYHRPRRPRRQKFVTGKNRRARPHQPPRAAPPHRIVQIVNQPSRPPPPRTIERKQFFLDKHQIKLPKPPQVSLAAPVHPRQQRHLRQFRSRKVPGVLLRGHGGEISYATPAAVNPGRNW